MPQRKAGTTSATQRTAEERHRKAESYGETKKDKRGKERKEREKERENDWLDTNFLSQVHAQYLSINRFSFMRFSIDIYV